MNLNNKWLALIPIGIYVFFTFVNISGYAYYLIMLVMCFVFLITSILVFTFFIYNKIWRPYPIIISAIAMVLFSLVFFPMLKDVRYILNPYETVLIDCKISIERKRAGRGGYNTGELKCKDVNQQPANFSIETAKAKNLKGKNFKIKYLPYSKSILEIIPISQTQAQ